MTNMFIPKKLRVGFVTDEETLSGKLAYVIYYDEKGNIRKEKSWKSWCDDDTEVLELDNIPQPNFILNKGIQRDGYWGNGHSKIRVHDPRDFEFEISVDNLMGILMHSNVSKRDIIQECVYAWHGTELVLLPTNSVEYQNSVVYTAKQDQKITAKDFVAGYVYQPKKMDESLIYIGNFEWFSWEHGYKHNGKLYASPKEGGYNNKNYFDVHKSRGKKHVFYNKDNNSFLTKTAADFSSIIEDTPVENYADLVDLFFTTENSQKIVSIKLSNHKKEYSYYDNHMYFVEDNTLIDTNISYRYHYYSQGIEGESVVFELNFIGYSLDFSDSISKQGGISITSDLTRNLTKEFEEKLGKAVPREQYSERENQIKAWLKEKGLAKNYSYVLSNQKATKAL